MNEKLSEQLIRLAQIQVNLMDAVQRMRIRLDELEDKVEYQARQIEGLEHERRKDEP